ncbi:EF hand domain-containing protein [Caballeronia catudaia]|uniref:EF hand domain-containing protein n=1 Tax=Caballeronia catudaia TaxID=1777136 RepID=A0A158BF44_9BURK|nr:M23 family metallopeptidase [Caballeronia catudaia]SAK68653.1 EF hand domain-containing protein [Caballeronia catudaia]
MIISPPFLPAAGLRNTDATVNPPIVDLMMDKVDEFELAHGTYPIGFDRRWHCGAHLMPSMQNEKVRAIADGEVVAYRVCQKAYDGGGGRPDSNAGFVLLKHSTETGDGRTLKFYSLYMHLLDLSSYNGADGTLLPEFLKMPTPGGDTAPSPAQKGVNLKVRRKDVLGWVGACHAQQHLHFEIFMTKTDYDAYFGRTQLGKPTASVATGNDCWGHTYYVIPAGSSFRALPPGADSQKKLKGIAFDPLQADRNEEQLFVEMFFHKGSKFTNVWAISGESRTLLTPTPVKETDYEYDMYKRATALYPACPSDGYELLRFGRILSPSPTLGVATGATPPPVDASVQGNPRPRDGENPRATWMRVTFAAGREGYIDVSPDAILKLSDADFSGLAGWEKISEGNTPFSADGLCDIDALKKIVRDTKEHQTPQETALKAEHKKEAVLANYVKTNKAIRERLKGFVCEAPSEWDSSNNEERYRKLKDEGEFYHGDDDGYAAFMKLLKSFQFWDKTGFADGEKMWFFHPLAFVRHFRKCGWLGRNDLSKIYNESTYVALGKKGEDYKELYRKSINNVLRKYALNKAPRSSHFFGQCAIESFYMMVVREASIGIANAVKTGHTSIMPESRGYLRSPPAAEADVAYFKKLYEGRAVLGNSDVGDGVKFRGRGFKQLTGRYNYSEYWVYRGWLDGKLYDHAWFEKTVNGRPMPGPQIDNPEEVGNDPYSCVDTAGFFCTRYLVTKAADNGITENVSKSLTKKVNPADTTSPPKRWKETQEAHNILGDSV